MAFLQTKRERFLMSLTAFAVLVGGGYLFVFQPLSELYGDLDSEIRDKEELWQEKKTSYVKSETLRQRFERNRESLSFEGTEAEIRQKIDQELTTLLEETEIFPISRQMNKPNRVHDDFVIYSFSLKGIETDWPTLSTLLYRIETSDAVLEVNRMDVRRNRRGEPLKVDLEISRLVENKVEKRNARRSRRRSS